jgi:hypothetical protein
MTDEPETPPKIVETIDQNLRRAYDSAASEPIPQKFLDLIAQLKTGDDQPSDPSDQDADGSA